MPTNGRRHVSTDLWLMYSAFLYLFIDLLLLSPDQSTTTTAQTTRLPSCRPDMRFLFIYLFRFNDFDIFNLFSLLLSSQVITYSSSLPARES
jgi:hypothetical protein